MLRKLTPRRLQVLDLTSTLSTADSSPTLTAIAGAMRLNVGGVAQHQYALIAMGMLERRRERVVLTDAGRAVLALRAEVAADGAVLSAAPCSRPELSPRQQEAYDWIRSQIAATGVAPTIREIGAALGISSTNGVSEILGRLETKGFVARGRHGSQRTIRIVGEETPVAVSPGADPLAAYRVTALLIADALLERSGRTGVARVG